MSKRKAQDDASGGVYSSKAQTSTITEAVAVDRMQMLASDLVTCHNCVPKEVDDVLTAHVKYCGTDSKKNRFKVGETVSPRLGVQLA